jgi:hypothetical protein
MNRTKLVFACILIVLVGSVLLPVRAHTPGGSALPGPAPADVDETSSFVDSSQRGERAGAGELCQCIDGRGKVATMRINEVLDGPLESDGIKFGDVPLSDVLAHLQDEYRIPIQIDSRALDEAGVGTDAPVTRELRGISLRSALKLLLEPLDLTWIIRDEVLLITTREKAGNYLVTCVYNVNDLLEKKDPDYDSLVDAITTCVATDTWAENGGGKADIRVLPPGLLVISQTPAIHEEITGLLTKVRNARGRAPIAERGPKQMPKSVANRSSSHTPAKDAGGGYF